MKEKKNIALLSPSKNAYSETFIQMHKNGIKGNVIYYYDGDLPIKNDVQGNLSKSFFSKKKFALKRKLKLTKLSVKEQLLTKSFKENNISIVVSEYGTTAIAVLTVCEKLNLDILPVFHGFEISIKSILKRHKMKYKELFKYCKKVVVVSNTMSKSIQELGCEVNKIIVTPCAPEDVFFENKPLYDNLNFISVGRFVEKKSPVSTIKAFEIALKSNKEIKLFMVGEGPLLDKCKEYIEQYNLNKNIFLLGKKTPLEIKELFKNSIAFLQHSVVAQNGDSEGTPVSVLEASASGLVVVSTFHTGIPDVILNNKTGFLVEEHDIIGMSHKILEITNNLDYAKKMGKKAQLFVKENFSKEKHLSTINKAIQSIIDE